MGTQGPNKTQPQPPSPRSDLYTLFLGSFQWPVSRGYNCEGLFPLYRFSRNSRLGVKLEFCPVFLGGGILTSPHFTISPLSQGHPPPREAPELEGLPTKELAPAGSSNIGGSINMGPGLSHRVAFPLLLMYFLLL